MDLLVGTGVSTVIRIVQRPKPFLTLAQPLRPQWLLRRDLASKKEGKRRGHILSIITSPKVGPNRCARLELLSLSLSVSSFFQFIFRKVTSVYDSSRVLSKVTEIKR